MISPTVIQGLQQTLGTLTQTEASLRQLHRVPHLNFAHTPYTLHNTPGVNAGSRHSLYTLVKCASC